MSNDKKIHNDSSLSYSKTSALIMNVNGSINTMKDGLNNNNKLDNTEIFNTLNYLIANGIEIDRNLRQPNFYSWVTFSELQVECFVIIADLLTNQRVPQWLSQRIAWYYSNKFFQEIIADLSLPSSNGNSNGNTNGNTIKIETKLFSREKILIHLRETISNIVKEWLNEKSKLFNQNIHSLVFSFHRTEKNAPKNLIFYEYGLKNKRRTMEDKTALYENIELFSAAFLSNSIIEDEDGIIEEITPKKANALFGVFDGHCGVDCAQYVSSHLPMSIIQHPEIKEKLELNANIEPIIIECFKKVNENFTKKAKEESLRSGCTACMCVLSSTTKRKDRFSKLNVAWCGDTQLCLVKNGKLHFMTEAHKPNNDNEKTRIENAGGTVQFMANTWRVNGSLGVARSFGDIDYQASGVCSDPDYKSFDLDGTEDYLIIGCDGLWESLNTKELCKFVYDQINCGTNPNIAELLVKQAKEQGSTDNITAIFVLLKENLDQISKPPGVF